MNSQMWSMVNGQCSHAVLLCVDCGNFYWLYIFSLFCAFRWFNTCPPYLMEESNIKSSVRA